MLTGKKVPYIRLFTVLIVAFILYRIVNNTEIITEAIRYILSLTSYFIWGFAIAYLLNPLMVFLERRFKLRRVWSLLIIYLFFIGILVFGIIVLTPMIMKNIRELLEHVPKFIIQTQDLIEQYIANIELFDDYNIILWVENNLNEILEQVNSILRTSFVEKSMGELIETINHLFSQTFRIFFIQAVNITSTLFKLLFGTVLSIYMLKDKEGFVKNLKRMVVAIFQKDKADYILYVCKKTNNIFSQYLIGKTLDSLIIGVLCFIGLLILRAPYPILISLIIAITNMIPYFGPFIGMVPAFIITLFFSPIKAVWVIIFIILLQQLDGWFIGPKILGDSVGMSPFWIIVAIIIGGGTFGLLGMLIGVPVLAVIKLLLGEYIQKRLDNKKLEAESL